MAKKNISFHYTFRQGRRKLLKVGGAAEVLKRTFQKKRAPKNYVREMLATGGVWGVGGHLKKLFRTYRKNFPDKPHFFLHTKKCFRTYRKILRKCDIFPGKEKIFPEITYIQVFKSALWAKNAILMTFFTQEKALLPKKEHLAKLGGLATRFLRPCFWQRRPAAKKYIRFHYTFSHGSPCLKSISHFTILLDTKVCD